MELISHPSWSLQISSAPVLAKARFQSGML
jgi:hypothetical protein